MRLQARRPFPLGNKLFGGPTVITCVPLVAAGAPEVTEQGRRLGALAPDCLEWRLDALAGLDAGSLPGLLADLARAAGCPLLVTNRSRAEGGWSEQPEAARLDLLAAAAATGIPALVDVELAADPAGADRVQAAARRAGVRIIRSWHDFGGTPPAAELLDRLRAAQESGADVAKVAVRPAGPDDVLRVLEAGLTARRTFLEIPCILLAMGALGAVTRLAGGHYGSDLTFAVGEAASAPGQLPLDLVRRSLAAMGLAERAT